jgi:addiction module HigA family antidote
MIRRTRRPTHPGELLREEFLPNTGMTRAELARLMSISRQTVGDLLLERRSVTPDIAIRLSRVFPMQPPTFWLRLQAEVDVWDAQRAKASEYERIKPARVA